LGKFWSVLQWYILWPFGQFSSHLAYILWPFGIFCGDLVYFPRFGMLNQEKSGNPGRLPSKKTDLFVMMLFFPCQSFFWRKFVDLIPLTISRDSKPGLPDGFFSNQKSQFG
jgi:hypothetical protein